MLGLNRRVTHGCHCNRPTLDTIRGAGFDASEVEHDTLKHAPKWVRPLIVGVAVAQTASDESARSNSSSVAAAASNLAAPTSSA
jgi:hypothetical protein